jgi:hypothetical protein
MQLIVMYVHVAGPMGRTRILITINNTNDPTNETVEANFEGRIYFFSSAQDPSEDTSVSMVPLIYLLLQCLTTLHQPYWRMAVLMLPMLR